MKQKKIKFTVYKAAEGGYYAISDYQGTTSTQGDTYPELKEMILEVANLAGEEEGRAFTWDDIEIVIDLHSFFDVYKELNIKHLATRAGVNASLLGQYVSGRRKPGPKQVARILEGIRSLGREMASLDLVL